MLEPKFVKDNIDKIIDAARNKKIPFNHLEFIETYEIRLVSIEKVEKLRRQRNEGSEAVKTADVSTRQEIIQKMKTLNSELSLAEDDLRRIEQRFANILLTIPSIPSEDTPLGDSDQDNVEIKKIGVPKKFNFTPKDHIELGIGLGIVDFQKGAQVAGSRSYFLIGLGARLERAIHSFAYDLLIERGYTPMSVPVLVRTSAMEGTGYLPAGKDQAYFIEKDDSWLVGTSEVSLASFYSNEVIENHNLPIKVCAHSSCFRREAGSHGKDTKGLYRVHQFQKIEQVIITYPDKDLSDELHAELLKNAEDILSALELPYRVVQVCTGDLGLGQVKKHDIETWMPSRLNYGETHSCSSFYDFQSRRLKIRVKDKETGKPIYAYTLNNTAVATPRLIIALLENYQQPDGSVVIPNALRPYMGGIEVIKNL